MEKKSTAKFIFSRQTRSRFRRLIKLATKFIITDIFFLCFRFESLNIDEIHECTVYSQCSGRPTIVGIPSNVTVPIVRYNSDMELSIRHRHCTGHIDSIWVRWPSRTVPIGWRQSKYNGWLPFCSSSHFHNFKRWAFSTIFFCCNRTAIKIFSTCQIRWPAQSRNLNIYLFFLCVSRCISFFVRKKNGNSNLRSNVFTTQPRTAHRIWNFVLLSLFAFIVAFRAMIFVPYVICLSVESMLGRMRRYLRNANQFPLDEGNFRFIISHAAHT